MPARAQTLPLQAPQTIDEQPVPPQEDLVPKSAVSGPVNDNDAAAPLTQPRPDPLAVIKTMSEEEIIALFT